MYRTTTCGALRLSNVGEQGTLAGWVQKARRMGGMTFIDLRDRYGITQLVFNEAVVGEALVAEAEKLGREYVIQIVGTVPADLQAASHGQWLRPLLPDREVLP